MRFILITFLLFLIIIFQTTILPHLKIGGILPNLILIIIILISLTTPWQKSLFLALIGGLMLDFFSSWPFGIFSLSLVIISFILSLTRFYLFTQTNFLVILAAVFLGTFFFDLMVIFLIKFMTLVKLSNLDISFKYSLLYLMPMEILYNLVSALVIFYLLKLIKKTT